MRAFLACASAELLRLRKWPAVWVVIVSWLSLALLFGYAFTYIGYRTGSGPAAAGRTRAQLLVEVLPHQVPAVLVQGMPMFGAALAVVLGALAAGNGFGWGTWKTAFTQGPSRRAVVGGSLGAVTVVVVGIAVLLLTLFLAVSSGIAAVEGQPLHWPAIAELARALGGGVLVLEMWILAGYAVGILVRGPALATGLGLVWVLVVENLLRSITGLLPAVRALTDVLPGTAGGSLVGAIVGSDTGGTPGVLHLIGGGRALGTVVAYLVLAAVVTLVVVSRRDVA